MKSSGFSTGIDTARVGACFMVVVLHVAALDFAVFDERWWASNFYDSFTRACVPIFLMISGVLLLDKQEGTRVFFKKRFVRILPPLLFWSLFYLGWRTWQGKDYGGLWDWVRELAHGPVAFHLWYLYAIVGIYLFVPFLRKIWQISSLTEKRVYLIAWAAVSGWPTIQAAFSFEVDLLGVYGMDSFFGLFGYLFLGAYLHEAHGRSSYKSWYGWAHAGFFVLFSTLTMVATFVYSRHEGAPDPLFYDYLSPLVMASSVSAFLVLYDLGARKVGEYSPQIKTMAAATLGIYCIHIFVLDVVQAIIAQSNFSASPWWSIPASAAVVFSVSMLLVTALRNFRPFAYVT